MAMKLWSPRMEVNAMRLESGDQCGSRLLPRTYASCFAGPWFWLFPRRPVDVVSGAGACAAISAADIGESHRLIFADHTAHLPSGEIWMFSQSSPWHSIEPSRRGSLALSRS